MTDGVRGNRESIFVFLMRWHKSNRRFSFQGCGLSFLAPEAGGRCRSLAFYDFAKSAEPTRISQAKGNMGDGSCGMAVCDDSRAMGWAFEDRATGRFVDEVGFADFKRDIGKERDGENTASIRVAAKLGYGLAWSRIGIDFAYANR